MTYYIYMVIDVYVNHKEVPEWGYSLLLHCFAKLFYK